MSSVVEVIIMSVSYVFMKQTSITATSGGSYIILSCQLLNKISKQLLQLWKYFPFCKIFNVILIIIGFTFYLKIKCFLLNSQWLNDSLLFPQDNDPLLGQSPWRSKISGSDTETLGGFPVEFLIQVVRIAEYLGLLMKKTQRLLC